MVLSLSLPRVRKKVSPTPISANLRGRGGDSRLNSENSEKKKKGFSPSLQISAPKKENYPPPSAVVAFLTSGGIPGGWRCSFGVSGGGIFCSSSSPSSSSFKRSRADDRAKSQSGERKKGNFIFFQVPPPSLSRRAGREIAPIKNFPTQKDVSSFLLSFCCYSVLPSLFLFLSPLSSREKVTISVF